MNNNYTRRDFLKKIGRYSGLGAAGYLGSSCGKGHHRGKIILNFPPHISVHRDFSVNDGLVRYTVIGDDIDGKVEELQVRYNGGDIEIFSDEVYTTSKEINRRNNVLEGMAIDNLGLKSSSDFEIVDMFNVPSRLIATEHIESLVLKDGNFDYFEYCPNKRSTIEFDYRDPIEVDLLISRKNNGGISVIKYIDIDESLTENYADRNELKDSEIDALYIFRAPIGVVYKLTKDFIDKDYRN